MSYLIPWLAIIFLLLYLRAGAAVWSLVISFAYMLTLQYSAWSYFSITITIILLVLLPALLPWSRRYLVKLMLAKLQEAIPKLSATEKEAISAGECGFEKQIITGKPKWKSLHAISSTPITTTEQQFIDGPLQQLLAMIDDWEIVFRNADINENIWDFIKKHGFLGMIIPKEYGGLGFSVSAVGEIFALLYAKSVTVATTVSVPNSLGPAELLIHYGTKEQQAYYLPRLAAGEEIPCFALTSPYAGSDATSMLDTGVVVTGTFDNKEIIGIKLNWNKRYITLAPVATLLGLAFKLYDPDKLLDQQEDIGITCALIPTNLPGITIGRRHYPLNTPFQNGPTSGKDVFIPLSYIVGGVAMAGKGWKMLMENLAAGRAIALPASALGGASHSLMVTTAYANARQQFNLPVSRFEGIQEVLARMAANTYIIDALFHMTINVIQSGTQAAIASAISKYHTTELGRKVINDAMDVHGGKAICLGPSNYLFAGYQATPIGITVEGANILTRSLIIFGQGLIRCHPYVLDELIAIEQGDHKAVDKVLCKHIGHALYNFTRSIVYGLTAGIFIKAPARKLKKYYKRFSKYSIYLSFLSDIILLIYQAGFKRKEILSGKLSDVLSYIYIGCAVLRKYKEDQEPLESYPLVLWILENLCYQIEQKIYGIISNLRFKPFRIILNILLFPYGKYSTIPTDNLDQQVSKLVTSNSETRKMLVRYASNKKNQQTYDLEKLFLLLEENTKLTNKFKQYVKQQQGIVKPVFEHINDAANYEVINPQEKKLLLTIEELRMKIINVDDFDQTELRRGQ